MKTFLWSALLLSASVLCAGGPFSVTDDGTLAVSWHGKPLVTSERFSILPQAGFAQAEARVEVIGDARVFNRFGDCSGVTYRREVALKQGGKEVEISFQMFFPAYHELSNDKGKSYALRLPWRDFADWHYRAVVGRISRPRELTGVIKPDMPSGKNVVGEAIRQITLTSPDGKKSLVIDCSPEGVGDFYSDYPPNGIMSLWGFQRDGDDLVVMLGYAPRFFGGTQTGKVQLYEGAPENVYDRRHAQRQYRYFSELEPDRQYVFGAKKFGRMYTDAGTRAYTAKAGFGWVDAPELAVENYRPSGAFYSKVSGAKPAVFRMDNLRKGLHLLTFAVPSFDWGAGPFRIAVNGKTIVSDLKTNPREVTVIHAPVWIENGRADIAFDGQWQISAVGDQLLLTKYEDFSFRRGFWLSTKGPHPSVMFQSGHYAQEPAYKVGVSSYPLPEPGRETAATRKALEYPVAHARFAPGQDWRGVSLLGSIGTSNNGSFHEFAQQPDLDRRLRDLARDNISAVILNGLLSRHTYPAHLDLVEKMIANIVRTGRKHRMKFIDHSDFSLLWQCDSGFRVLTERMDQLQQTVDCQLPARGLCPTNPESRRVFFEFMKNFVQKTDVDGIMVDEVAFHGLNFCGCAACRKQFTADTGWVLPADETSPHLQNKLSPLWRTWQIWRQKAVGDFWYALRQELKPIRPDLVFIGYTTHYGLYSTYATLNFGAAMEQLCRTWDYVGTEIMSRNGYASYRSLMCFRKMKNMFRNVYGVPVFGLVYNDARDWNVMYFGWALNNMNAQNTWEMGSIPCPPGAANHRLFTVEKGNMDSRTAVSAAKIALLFSNYSRDCDRSASAHTEVMGLSQILSGKHIPHEFIFEAGLTPEVLSRYPVLIVGNATALSEANLRAIRDYAQNGGVVYCSSFAGYYDEIAMKRPHWLLGEMLLAGSDYHSSTDSPTQIYGVKDPATGKIAKFPGRTFAMRYRYARTPELETVLEYLGTPSGSTLLPGLLRRKTGKGEVWFSPAALGASSCAMEVTSKKPMSFAPQPEAEAIAWDVLKRVAGKHFVWEPLAIPERVLTSLYETSGGKLAVHFLNATKSVYKKGEILPSTAPQDAFAPLPEEMRFRIARPGVKAVYAVSPDFEGRKALPFRRDGEMLTVTIPAGTLRGYMIVYLE